MTGRWIQRALLAGVIGLLSGTSMMAAAQQSTAVVPSDLGAYVRELGAKLRENRAEGMKSVYPVAKALQAAELKGEDRLYAGLVLLVARQNEAALQRLTAYLAESPRQREQALAAAIEAASWKEAHFKFASSRYDDYLTHFRNSSTTDLLTPGVLLRVRVEQAMARVASLSKSSPLVHYERALEAFKQSDAASVPVQDVFNLRWYFSDAIAEHGNIDDAIQFLIETRPLVKADAKIALQLEDRIVFKQTQKLLGERKHEAARALLEKRLPEMTGDGVVQRRVSKLLDRVKLVDAPAPEFVPGHWIGGAAQTLAGLKGKVVLLEFFSSG